MTNKETNKERKTQSPEQGLSALVGQHMDQSTGTLDPSITARLAAGRRKALEQMGQEPPKRSRAGITGMGLAASVAMVAVLATFYTGNDTPTGPATDADALEMMAAEDPLALYEDLEFYLWMEEQNLSTPPQEQAG